MKNLRYLFCLPLLMFIGCSQGGRDHASSGRANMAEMAVEKVVAEDASPSSAGVGYDITDVFSSSAASVYMFPDSMKQLVREGDVRFRVKGVVESTLAIEKIVREAGGYVEDTKLASEAYSRRKVRVSKDSVVTVSSVELSNNFVLRIPSKNLDQALIDLSPMIEQLDFRNISVTDVSFDILAKRMEQSRLARYGRRMESGIDDKGKKLESIESAENSLLRSMERSDNAKLDAMRLNKDIAYSVVRLCIYQNKEEHYNKEYVSPEIDEYRPSFWQRLGAAFMSGIGMLGNIFVGIMQVWWLWILIGVGAYYGRKAYIRKNKK